MRHRPLRVSYQLGRVVTPEGLVVVVVAQRPVRDHRVKPWRQSINSPRTPTS